jgi:putative ABC transport system ATP-binding protein
VALVGRSGSGKTTLLHVIAGLIQPTDGLVEWDGRPMSTLDAAARGRARAAGIGLVFQSPTLFSHLTAFENVAFARCVSQAEGNVREPLELLTLVGLEAKADSLPGELSGGEAQRVAIARALAQRPQLLLCDEPTGHLDSDTGARVLDLVDALQAEFGFSLITATHDSDVAARSAREVELEDGQIVREGVFR